MNKSLAITLGALLMSSGAAFAQEEPVVNVYNWTDYIAEDTIAKFTAETGITVNYTNYTENETLEAALLAGSSGYDVVFPSGFFLERQIEIGVYQPLDKAKLPNLANMDPVAMKTASTHDADNAHSIPYMTFTTGFGYNPVKIKEIMPDAPVDSWDLIFKPEIVSKFKDCGVSILDAPAEVVATALNYLGLDPNSESEEDLAKAEELLASVRPFIRYYRSSGYIEDLAAGNTCIAMGYSGDIFIAKDEAAEGVEVEYTIPKEGAISAFDLMAIPADAPHPDNAHKFINFIMQPEVTADITNFVFYASANAAATEFVDEEIRNNPGIYPPADVAAKLFALSPHTDDFDSKLVDAFTRVTSGQ
jgi:putrescine transport system substrate-binding protein